MSSEMAHLPLIGPQTGVTDDLEEGGLFFKFRNCDQMAKTEAIWPTMESAISSYACVFEQEQKKGVKLLCSSWEHLRLMA